MDASLIVAKARSSGATLHSTNGALYIAWIGASTPHWHRLPLDATDACGDRCPLHAFRDLTVTELDLLYASEGTVHCTSTISGTHTDTWHIEACDVHAWNEPWEDEEEAASFDAHGNPEMPVGCLVRGTNADLLQFVAGYYIHEGDRVCDMTYGKGVFWQKCTDRRMTLYASDLKHLEVDPALLDGTYPLRIIPRRADFRQLPYANAFFDTVVLDPPYAHHMRTHITGGRYTDDTTADKSHVEIMTERYLPGIVEAARILKPGGTLWIKGKNQIESGKQCWASHEIPTLAEADGYFVWHNEVLLQTRPPNPNRWKRQLHLRKTHSFLQIFARTDVPVQVLGTHGGYRRPAHAMVTLPERETKTLGTSSTFELEPLSSVGTLSTKKTRSRGNSSHYLRDRLLRDYPRLFLRLQMGEFRSVRAAAVAAGLVKARR
jgi:hypothetical protein